MGVVVEMTVIICLGASCRSDNNDPNPPTNIAIVGLLHNLLKAGTTL